MMFYSLVLAVVVVSQYVGAVPRLDPLVDSNVGLIRGQRATDGDYSMFLGIPYAKLDINNPFGVSVPQPKFEGIFEAFDDSVMCPQIEEFNNTILGTIDCLQLNVYAPTSASPENQLPVLVWIYGGGFILGSFGRTVYGPRFLVRHDVILVTVNYRLGPYGFMCLDDPIIPGNQGLRDQRLALRWVKNNIEAFGGDSNKITIFGESAGSASVDFQLHRPQENIFNQAILQSGTVLNPWSVLNSGNEAPLQLAEYFGLKTDDLTEAVSFLAPIEPNLIIDASNQLGLAFRPCVEKDFENVEPFLSNHPVNLPTPIAKEIPILIGFNDDEGVVFYGDLDVNLLEQLDIIGENVVESFNFDNDLYEEMTEILRHFYFGDREVSEETRRSVINVSSDIGFAHPTQRSIRKYLEGGAESVYSYVFSYVGQRNYLRFMYNVTIGGAAHADELSYLFDTSFVKDIMPEEDQVIVDRMTTLWTNFAKYGNPTPETSELLPVTWVPATRDRWNYLNIDSELTMETRPFNDRMAFLELFYRMYEKNQIGYRENNATTKTQALFVIIGMQCIFFIYNK